MTDCNECKHQQIEIGTVLCGMYCDLDRWEDDDIDPDDPKSNCSDFEKVEI